MDDAQQVSPGSVAGWRRWLAEHHAAARGVWLDMTDRSGQGPEVLSYENAVREALCWGWIDGQVRGSVPGRAPAIWMSPRRTGSPWAASNRARVAELQAEGRMPPAGQVLVDAAQADGSWTVLVGPEQGVEPDALRRGLDADLAARAFWDALPASARLYALTQVATAKREATAQARIEKLLAQCRAGERPDR